MKAIRVPHVFTLLTAVVFACSLLTFVVPSGEYQRATRSVGGRDRTVVVADTYTNLPKHLTARGLLFKDEAEGMASPASLEGFLSAIPRGMVSAADIIFFIFIIGGAFGVVNGTGAVEASIHAVVRACRGRGEVAVGVLVVLFSIAGATIGMAEETLVFLPGLVILAKRLGYDEVTAGAMALVGAGAGFSGALPGCLSSRGSSFGSSSGRW
jgi:uncharacterized ion transporter superfamily protein YfcC